METQRLIKKYPNRRLYDTTESRYITLADIRSYVVYAIDFVVLEKTSQKDITDRILLQVISEQEQSGEPILGRDFLLQTIRLHGSPSEGAIGEHQRQIASTLVSESRDNYLTRSPMGPVPSVAVELLPPPSRQI